MLVDSNQFDNKQLSVSLLKNIKSNTQIRYIQLESCVVVSVQGPIQSNRPNNVDCVLDIQIKFETNKAFEQELKEFFQQIICLNEYPTQLIKISCIIQINKGNIQSTIINGIQIALLLQGIALKHTIMAITQSDTTLALNVNNNGIMYFHMERANSKENIQQIISSGRMQTKDYANWLRSYLLQYQYQYQ